MLTCSNRAWIFAAGLLLGFCLFAQGNEPDFGVRNAFDQSRKALQKMAAFSPQAGHYFEILTSFDSAIGTHWVQSVEEQSREMIPSPDQFLTFDEQNGEGQQTGAASLNSNDFVFSESSRETLGQDLLSNDAQSIGGTSYSPFGLGVSEGFPWPADDLDIDWQPFAPFLDDMG